MSGTCTVSFVGRPPITRRETSLQRQLNRIALRTQSIPESCGRELAWRRVCRHEPFAASRRWQHPRGPARSDRRRHLKRARKSTKKLSWKSAGGTRGLLLARRASNHSVTRGHFMAQRWRRRETTRPQADHVREGLDLTPAKRNDPKTYSSSADGITSSTALCTNDFFPASPSCLGVLDEQGMPVRHVGEENRVDIHIC